MERLTRHVEHCMGTVFSFAIADEGSWPDALAEAVGLLHRADELFSTYRPDSEVSRLRTGQLAPADADPLVKEVLALCESYRVETAGLFTPHLPGGFDPTGLVKGWAVERASAILRRHGSSNHLVNGGGDVQAAGSPGSARDWRVGISDPAAPGGVVMTLSGRDFAVATSGTAERGSHVVDPRSGLPAGAVASVTVMGRWLTRVDVAATASFVLGEEALDWLEQQPGLEGVVVGLDGTVRTTANATRPAEAWLAGC